MSTKFLTNCGGAIDGDSSIDFDNGSKFKKGTIDAGLGGNKGVAQICAVGYELKWEAGRLYVMNDGGVTIRQSLFNFSDAPTPNEDETKGYQINSLYILDDNTTYKCTDATTGNAVWNLLNPSSTVDILQIQMFI